MNLEVLEPGLLTTIQDTGRREWAHLGVPSGGACDTWSLAVANLLAGNERGAAVLELTIDGGVFRVTAPLLVGVAGAELGGVSRDTGTALTTGRAHRLDPGSTIAFPGIADAGAGARAYLALAGGIDVPAVLGSGSTALAAGFGGLDGRALRAGDVVRTGSGGQLDRRQADATWPADVGSDRSPDAPIRIVAGPWPGADELAGGAWRVAAGSDRVGLRLEGEPIRSAEVGGLPSIGVVPGAVQLPSDGAPIVLMADAQTTGGYPVAATVIAADLPRLAQLRPGSEIRFERVTVPAATEALRRQQAALDLGARLLRESARWDDAWRGAGA
jgi:biotin-dependent carboxylase-like uncharacterized protein